MRNTRNPEDMHPELRKRWEWLVDVWKEQYPNHPTPKLTCVYRDKPAQQRAYRSNKSNAQWKESLHNYKPSYALDFHFEEDNQAIWEFEPYRKFGNNAKRLGLEWGGDWHSKDGTHIQLPMTYIDAQNANIPRLTPPERTWYGIQIRIIRTLQAIKKYYEQS